MKIGKELVGMHQFTLSDKLSTMRIDRATLHVHVKMTGNVVSPAKPTAFFNVRLMELVTTKKGDSPVYIFAGQFKATLRPSSSTLGPSSPSTSSSSRWVQVEVKDALVKWMGGDASSSGRLGYKSGKKISLKMEAVDADGNLSRDVIIDVPKGNPHQTQPSNVSFHPY
jgi:hypothetical protein